jgi:hypothetical protein
VLLDQQAYARGSSTNIDGPCHDSSEAPLPLLPHRTAALHASGSASDGNSHSGRSRHGQLMQAAADTSAAAAAAGADDIPLRQKYMAVTPQHSQAVAAQQQQQQHEHHDTEMWQQQPIASSLKERCSHMHCSSPFCHEACSEASSPDMLLYLAGRSSTDEPIDGLISNKMLVKDAAAAAALFPAEQGAFAVEQRLY